MPGILKSSGGTRVIFSKLGGIAVICRIYIYMCVCVCGIITGHVGDTRHASQG
jgi:hypothetical protein